MIDTFYKSLAINEVISVSGLRGSSTAMLAAWTAAATDRRVVCVLPSERRAEQLEQDIRFFTDMPVTLYPGYDIPPYTPLSPDQETVAARLSALYQLKSEQRASIVVASCESILRRVIPGRHLTDKAELVIRGEEVDLDDFVSRLADAGYEHVSLVQNIGDYSIRGGIFDVYAPGYSAPIRLDFFGDTIESLRSFDPISQRSMAELEEAVLLPASNILFPATGSREEQELKERFLRAGSSCGWDMDKMHQLLEQLEYRHRFPGIEQFLPLFYPDPAILPDFFDDHALVFDIDPPSTKQAVQLCWERIEANHAEAGNSHMPVLPPDEVFLTPSQFDSAFTRFKRIQIVDIPDMANETGSRVELKAGDHKPLKQEIDLQRRRHGLLQPLVKKASDWLARSESVILSCRSKRTARQLAELLEQHALPVVIFDEPVREAVVAQLSPDTVYLSPNALTEGFDLFDARLHIVSESELFGVRSLPSRRQYKPRHPDDGGAVRFDQLSAGDIVVHREHGIGIYEGLIHMVHHGVANDFLQIGYRGKDRLYVPIDRIHSVSKYKGLSEKIPKLDRLGSQSWNKIKKKVKEAVWAVAQDLLELYAKRELEVGRAYSQPDELYAELEESFPYDETPGQNRAIQDVLGDLVSEKTMDRLLCGDVGYGKTEVAVRAALKVIEDGFQAAVLVPTTVLAEQHGRTFRERLAGFPVRVESLSRFRSRALQQEILRDLAAGRVDVIIGTHRLLSKDVRFLRLGLLVVDEEHRFGVSHKEKIKRLRTKVDVLTLSATPIPRTLQMSLLGVRDLSVIDTPPEQRRPVKTFVSRYDDLVIKEAVIREMQREGQTFIVHNRVQSIHKMAQKVQRLVPDARVAVGHGQMPAKKLEEIMVRFINRELDVLVCTTIIESGLDITNANTIIINRADSLGLAEIYQLRGRVGRGTEQSYAYLLVPSLDGLTKDARDRLRALMDCSELGGGFKLALSDLQIRGGGNILGVSQSGHIEAVGYDLYLDLLQRTVTDLKNKAARDEERTVDVEPEINLQISAYIPDTYIADANQRYLAYRRLSDVATPENLQDLQEEFRDRFGELPVEAGNLFEIVALKMALRKIRIMKLEQGRDSLVFTFQEHTSVSPQAILRFMEEAKEGGVRFTPDARLIVQTSLQSAGEIFRAAAEVLSRLGE